MHTCNSVCESLRNLNLLSPHTLYVLDLVNSYREGWIALNAKFGRLIFLCDIQVEYEIGENYSYVPDRGEVLDFS